MLHRNQPARFSKAIVKFPKRTAKNLFRIGGIRPKFAFRLLNAGGCRLGNQNERIAERATPAENLTENPPKKLLGGRTFAQTRALCGDPNMLQIPFHSLRMRPNKARIFHKMPQSTQKNLPTAFRQNKVCKLRANQPASPKTLPTLLQAPTTATPSPE